MDLEPALHPVDRADSLAGKVYQQLRSALVGGRLVPGQKLVHRLLAAELGVSPTPVREALLRLVSEGALELDARGIAWVPRLEVARYDEIMDLRIELEGRAAARAAMLATPAEIAALAEIQARLLAGRRAMDRHVVLQENERFHFGVIAVARLPVLRRVVESLWVQVGPTINLLFAGPRELSPQGHPHDALLAALGARDAEAARAAVRRDLCEHARVLSPLLARGPRPEPAPSR
ncbi:GntR family transcriptional regulator [Roseococcus sp. SYP-B2431]|uniref:GntR family transcriptional regulator n=1 Tax=Roseococcus sp. SYP-B2431 TaxID=2496640 RepID=UPI0013F45D11|nr:GntR family transcriptional regulator [Roseococcus sp. SYP-B2431]